jgi:hypothetical protein
MNVDAGDISLFEAQGRAGNDPVDGHAPSGLSGDIDFLLGNGEVIFDSCGLGLKMGKEGKEDQARNCRSSKAKNSIGTLSPTSHRLQYEQTHDMLPVR